MRLLRNPKAALCLPVKVQRQVRSALCSLASLTGPFQITRRCLQELYVMAASPKSKDVKDAHDWKPVVGKYTLVDTEEQESLDH